MKTCFRTAPSLTVWNVPVWLQDKIRRYLNIASLSCWDGQKCRSMDPWWAHSCVLVSPSWCFSMCRGLWLASYFRIKSKRPLGLKWVYLWAYDTEESLAYDAHACTFQWAGRTLPCSAVENMQRGSWITPSVPACSWRCSGGLLMARRSKRVGGGGLRACGGQFVASSGWVEACLVYCSADTQPGSKALLQLQVVSDIMMKTTLLWFGLFFHSQRRGETDLLGHFVFSCGIIDFTSRTAESWKPRVSLTWEQHLVCVGRLWKSSLAPLDLYPCTSVWEVFLDTEICGGSCKQDTTGEQ